MLFTDRHNVSDNIVIKMNLSPIAIFTETKIHTRQLVILSHFELFAGKAQSLKQSQIQTKLIAQHCLALENLSKLNKSSSFAAKGL